MRETTRSRDGAPVVVDAHWRTMRCQRRIRADEEALRARLRSQAEDKPGSMVAPGYRTQAQAQTGRRAVVTVNLSSGAPDARGRTWTAANYATRDARLAEFGVSLPRKQ